MKRLINLIATLTALFTVAGVVSCSKGDHEPQLGDGVIRIGSSSIAVAGEGAETETKAINTTTSALTDIWFFLRTDVLSATLQSNMSGGSTAMGNRASGATAAITWTSAPVPQYDKKTKYYAHLVACHPGSGTGVTASAASVIWTIDGKTDVMTSDRFSAGTYLAPTPPTIVFKHRLAALEVIIKPQAGVSADVVSALWGQITGVELIGTATTATFNATSTAGANEGLTYSGSGNLPLLKGNTYNDTFDPLTIPASNSTAVSASGMFAPSTGTITLRVNSTGGAPVDVVVQLKNGAANADFVVGRKHTVTLVLNVPDRTLYVDGTSIAPWGDGGESGGSVIPPQQTKTPATGYLDWNYTGLVKTGLGYTLPVFTMNSYNSWTTTNNGGRYIYAKAFIDAERPYVSLEIAKTEETGTGTGWKTTSVQTQGKGNADGSGGSYTNVSVVCADWATAYAACKAKTTDGGGWRLPRASELMLMKMNQSELEKTAGFTTKFSNLSKWTWRPPYTDSNGKPVPGYWTETYYSAENSYWAATDGAGTTAWIVRFGGGNTMYPAEKTAYYRVRCVKESI